MTTLAVAVVFCPERGTCLVVSDAVEKAERWLVQHPLNPETVASYAAAVKAPILLLDDAIRLLPIHIPKPWGQEIWYTGIEVRGQSCVTDGRYSIPLPWLLAIGDDSLLQAGGGQPNLLKILDPLSEEVFGDLYYELHQEKREVYVVTRVDAQAWPDGCGAIRYGINQQRRREYGSDAAFRQQYLAAVKRYEHVRREIDAQLDEIRHEQGVALNEPVFAETLKSWLARIPSHLLEQEISAREHMNSFTALRPLHVGDVVKVSCLTPHALQHGVRTVEFQTPVYERKILSFAQKVLTQDHWDTEEAVALMALDPSPAEALMVVEEGDGFTLEQVVSFDDFCALRLTLAPKAQYPLGLGDRYKLVMAVDGCAQVGRQVLNPEDAVLVPRTATACRIVNLGDEPAVCLISHPA